MSTEREILVQRIDERLRELRDAGVTARSASIKATGKPDAIRDIKRAKGLPNGPTLARIAEALQTTGDWLMGKVENPGALHSEVTFHELPQGWNGPTGEGIPLILTAYCDDLIIDQGESGETVQIERIQLEVDHVLRRVQRPVALWNVHDAYAIEFHGSSMERRYYQGDIGIVDPRRPPSPGQVGLFQLTDGERSGVVTALAKELVRATTTYVELLQYNPEVSFRVPREQVVHMHRIFRPDELLYI